MSELEQENIKLKKQIEELKLKLQKYTNPERSKKYYHAHKEELKKRNYKKSNYKPTKEQRKEYNKKYYEKKKLKNKI